MSKQLNRMELFFLRQIIKKKLKDFETFGYLNVVEDEIWEYVDQRIWKKTSKRSLVERKKDIQRITINDFFDYQQIKAQTKRMDNFSFEDIQDLF